MMFIAIVTYIKFEIYKTIYIFQGVAPTASLLHIWLKTSLYLLKYAYALNLALGMIFLVIY